MKKIIFILTLLILFYNCGDNASEQSDWPEDAINTVLNNCMNDGNSKKACDCVIKKYQNTFTYSEIEQLSANEIDNFDDVDYNDTKKLLGLLMDIFEECKILPE